mmetsp:Transcript_110143/g.310550  ORF Transcript_110143/g.310550 Transcript_110143/m.310550 type:complete len:242 (-) Transcript_110143:476-1201(-)
MVGVDAPSPGLNELAATSATVCSLALVSTVVALAATSAAAKSLALSSTLLPVAASSAADCSLALSSVLPALRRLISWSLCSFSRRWSCLHRSSRLRASSGSARQASSFVMSPLSAHQRASSSLDPKPALDSIRPSGRRRRSLTSLMHSEALRTCQYFGASRSRQPTKRKAPNFINASKIPTPVYHSSSNTSMLTQNFCDVWESHRRFCTNQRHGMATAASAIMPTRVLYHHSRDKRQLKCR